MGCIINIKLILGNYIVYITLVIVFMCSCKLSHIFWLKYNCHNFQYFMLHKYVNGNCKECMLCYIGAAPSMTNDMFYVFGNLEMYIAFYTFEVRTQPTSAVKTQKNYIIQLMKLYFLIIKLIRLKWQKCALITCATILSMHGIDL